jgi:NADPH2 dehydrogenase
MLTSTSSPGANGYLIDQFFQDVSNHRTDAYGGSIPARARFGLEVTRACIAACGNDPSKVAIRLSPFGKFQGMGMEDPVPQFNYIVSEMRKLNLAYLHLIESRESGSAADGVYFSTGTTELKPFIEAWGPDLPIILAGGFDAKKAKWVVEEVATGKNVLIGFGRYFISTPDVVFRLKHGIELNKWERKTFYSPGEKGLLDYPFSDEFLKRQREGKDLGFDTGSRL